MDLKKIRYTLDRLAELVGGWDESAGVDVLERDVALAMLRDIYAEMRLGDIEPRQLSKSEPEPEQVTVSEPEPESEPESESEPKVEVESEPEPLPEPEPENPIVARRVVDPAIIRTLYGSEPIAPKSEPEHQKSQPEPEPEKPTIPHPIPQTSNPTLGDVMSGGRQTLGDTLGTGRTDMASRIAAAEASSLRSAIGLNDKFLMIRDMFEGSDAAFEEAIARLDEFGDLDEAIIYIHDTYDWSADSEGVKLLVELLERKLS